MIQLLMDCLTCRIRQVFFVFIMVTVGSVFAAPKISYSVEKTGSEYKVRITGSSLGTIKSGLITCGYKAQVDIDNASVYSPLTSIAIGASINRANNQVKITLSAMGKVTIDNSELLCIEFKITGLEENSVFGVLSAEFTDPQGTVRNAEIAPVYTLPGRQMANGIRKISVDRSFLLNGRSISQSRVQKLRNEIKHGDVSLRIIKRK